jgi:hypothetical protein
MRLSTCWRFWNWDQKFVTFWRVLLSYSSKMQNPTRPSHFANASDAQLVEAALKWASENPDAAHLRKEIVIRISHTNSKAMMALVDQVPDAQERQALILQAAPQIASHAGP